MIRDQEPGVRGQDSRSSAYQRYADLVEKRPPVELRDLLDFAQHDRQPVPLAEVEPVEAILRRFSSAAMSHGYAELALTHQTLAIAMTRLGGLSNSGEGGEAMARLSTNATAASSKWHRDALA